MGFRTTLIPVLGVLLLGSGKWKATYELDVSFRSLQYQARLWDMRLASYRVPPTLKHSSTFEDDTKD